MPSERSLYRKIQEVLETAKSANIESLEDLRDRLVKRDDRMFRTKQYNPERDTLALLPSHRVVRSTVRMCCLVGLIVADGPNEGQLTAAGRQALRSTRFDSMVRGQVREFLQASGVSLAHINRAISEGLQARPAVLPTSSALWRAAGGSVPKGTFTRLLTLLGHAGGAESTQRKIYLHIGAD